MHKQVDQTTLEAWTLCSAQRIKFYARLYASPSRQHLWSPQANKLSYSEYRLISKDTDKKFVAMFLTHYLGLVPTYYAAVRLTFDLLNVYANAVFFYGFSFSGQTDGRDT